MDRRTFIASFAATGAFIATQVRPDELLAQQSDLRSIISTNQNSIDGLRRELTGLKTPITQKTMGGLVYREFLYRLNLTESLRNFPEKGIIEYVKKDQSVLAENILGYGLSLRPLPRDIKIEWPQAVKPLGEKQESPALVILSILLETLGLTVKREAFQKLVEEFPPL